MEAVHKNVSPKSIVGEGKIYPNPSTGIFDVQIKEIVPTEWVLFNSSGQRIHIKQKNLIPSIGNSGMKLNLGHLPDGIYFLKFSTPKGEEFVKLLKEQQY